MEFVEHDVGPARQVFEAGGLVRQIHRVALLGVLEVVENPFLFHQPAGELEIGFAVLHAIIARIVGAFDVVLVEVDAGQHFGEDVGHAEMLENAAVHVSRELREGRQHFGPIADEIGSGFRRMDFHSLADAEHDAVEIARVFVGNVEPHAGVLPQQLVERQRVVGLGQHRQRHVKRARQPFADRELLQQQLVVAQIGADGDRAIFLA